MKYLLFLFALFLCSCHAKEEKRTLEQLEDIESYLPQRPDSALVQLEQEEAAAMSGEVQALYFLLLTAAQDKCYRQIASDSLISIAVDYYERQGNVERQAQAWYYKGRVNQELGNPLLAQSCYLKSLEYAQGSTDYDLLGRINNYIGTLYTMQDAFEEAQPYLRQAIKCFQKAHVITGCSFSLRNLARTYSVLEQPDSALFYYKEALALKDSVSLSSIHSELAGIYVDLEKYTQAEQHIRQALSFPMPKEHRYPIYLILGNLYLQKQQLDSASYYFQQSKRSRQLETRTASYGYLREIAEMRGDCAGYIHMNETYLVLRDSIYKARRADLIRREQYRHESEQKKEELAALQLNIAQGWIRFWFICSICLVASSFVVYLRKHLKEKARRLVEQERHLQVLVQQLNRQEEEIRQLQQIHSEIASKLACEEDVPISEKQVAAFRKMDIYKRFHSEQMEKSTQADWEELVLALNLFYNNFVDHLRERCPDISEKEIRIACLIKIELNVTTISKLLCCTVSNVSKVRSRLYKKLTGKEGSASDFDSLIRGFW